MSVPPQDHLLAAYGTLRPGEPNEHIMEGMDGTWTPALIRARLYPSGVGRAGGYPGVVLDPAADPVPVQLFCSADLPEQWDRLDDFEGPGYRRVPVQAEAPMQDQTVTAWIYELAPEAVPPQRD